MSDTATVEIGTIETRIPARLDRLPWTHFHWLIIGGLGTAWILDGLEVTMVGSVAARLTQSDSGLNLSASDIGLAGAIYIVGACLGALVFGQLCDRFGRKKLFMITLNLYIISTVLTAFSVWPWWFFAARFLTGAGIGGEYSAVNSAIDELIPARVRGRVDLIINGSYWLGSIAGSAAALFFLSGVFPDWLGWRVAFGVGAVIGLAVLLVRKNVPESPRWLFIHGFEDRAETLVDRIEHDIEEQTGEELSHPDKSITVRQRKTVRFREIGRVAVKSYPKRSILCIALFVGQAFIYNGVTFNLGTLMSTFFGVSAAIVPVFIIIYAAGNFTGPLVLGRLFDTVGRKPMISGTYIGSAALSVVLAWLFFTGMLNSATFIIIVVAVFLLASAGASAAYLTASEIFPMETRALAIAFFYAIGTAIGGISGPLLFGNLIATKERGPVALAFLIGAGVMALGGVVELFFGVNAEGQQLEDIAKPLTVGDAEGSDGDSDAGKTGGQEPDRSAASHERAQADQERARAAEHRATAHDLTARGIDGDKQAEERAETERELAEIAEMNALVHDERATAEDELADADTEDQPNLELAARERARAARERAASHEQDAQALSSQHGPHTQRHEALSAAALERARSREQNAQAQQLRASAGSGDDGANDIDLRRAETHDLWSAMHTMRAHAYEAQAEGNEPGQREADTAAEALAEQARAAEERVAAAGHRADAGEEQQEQVHEEEAARDRDEAAARRAAEQRARARIERRREQERHGLRRYRPGPGRTSGSPGMGVTSRLPEPDLDKEISALEKALDEHGATERHALAQMVGARYWGPGVFRDALRQATRDGSVHRTSHSTYARTDDEAHSHR